MPVDSVEYLLAKNVNIQDGAAAVPLATPAALAYRGGPVISGPQLISFYWGAFTPEEIGGMQGWLAGFSGYLNGAGAPLGQDPVLAQYGVIGASLGPSHVEPEAPESASDADVHDKVNALQASGALPLFSWERIFLVFTKGISFSGYGRWCAYHGKWAPGATYAICPYPSAGGCGSNDPIASWQSVTSHEINEAVTDPGTGTGWVAGTEEGADVCAWQNVTLPFGTVQRFDDNLQTACSIYTTQETIPLSATSWAANRLDLFMRGGDQTLIHKAWTGNAWGALEPLGGVIRGRPPSVAWGPNRLDIFARGQDNGLFHRWWNGHSWGGWEPLGGTIIGDPEVVSWGSNRLDIFAEGTDGALWHKAWLGSSWGGWETLGGVIIGPPASVSWGANRLDIFARGLDGAMWHRWWDGHAWQGWASRGGTLVSKPVPVSWGPNRLDIFARGLDNAVYHRWWDGNAWGGWESIGGTIIGPPSAVSWGANRLDIFVINTDHTMGHRAFDGHTWNDWESLGGTIVGAPVPVSWSANHLDVFARGMDNAIWHQRFDGQTWGGWESLGGVIG